MGMYQIDMRPPKWWWVVMVILILLWLTSCRSQQLARPSEDDTPQNNTTRIEYKDRLIRDTTYILDSVYIREKADTVWITRWREKYTERVQRDTIYTQRTDTIRLTKRMYIKEQLSKADNAKMFIGGCVLWLLMVLIACGIAFAFYKLTQLWK